MQPETPKARQPGFLDQLSLFFSREHVIHIPTVRKNAMEIRQLVALRNALPPGPARVSLDFTDCASLSLSAVVFIGGLAASVRNQGGSVRVLEKSVEV